ncbi:restriction endonuclease subunit S [Streptomyces anandii]|uniref:Restriction endonuclease subunit S n=1 Tax=Streptomyces anandii TaxID=285454 RepID=A0ABW6HD15_9ACTN
MSGRSTTLRAAADVVLGRQRAPQHDSGPNMVPYLRAANVKDGVLDLTDVKEMNFAPSEQQTFSLRPGDVLITEGSGSISAVGASAVWRGEINGVVCFQNTLLRLRPRDDRADGRFLEWWARSAFGSGVFASIASGANIYHISAERVRALPIELPPLEEQRRIADFLDAETARIDRLAAARDAQLFVLEERELAVIGHMLSGGATSQGGMPTDWPWLPHIPANWSIGPVYAYYSTELGKMLNPERASGEKLRPYLRNANVHWYEINTADMAYMHFEADEVRRYSVAPGDLLVCEGGAGVAEAAVWDGRIEECYFQKSLHRVRQSSEVPVEWLMYWLRFAKACGVFDASGNLATIPHLTGEQLRQYRIPIPRDGRSRIRETSRKIRDMAKARTLLNTAQKRLSERRQALITAAVTGQFDVSTASGRNVTDGVSA